LRHYFWDDPNLYKEGIDGIMRRCVPKYEQQEILRKCHCSAYAGHHAGDRTAQKILQSGFYCLPFLKMLGSLFYLVMNANELVTFLDAMICL
jgi:hypothetical protein